MNIPPKVNYSYSFGGFAEYWKDYIGLTIYEDVSLNLGYLVSLYNSLSWSRINGKRLIPENLLRFDIKLTIKEVKGLKTYTMRF